MHNRLGRVKFSGKSGAFYSFTAYPLETVFSHEFSGVYVVTQRKEGKSKSGFVHRRFATGQSDHLCSPLASDKQSFAAQGANCICLHVEANQAARLKIEQDLFREPHAAQA